MIVEQITPRALPGIGRDQRLDDPATVNTASAPSRSSRSSSASPGEMTPRSRFRARCWVTRTAPGVEPTASAVSSALSPTATRNINTSRWRGVSWCNKPPRRWASSPARASCSGSSCCDRGVGKLGHRLGAVAADGPEGVGHLVRRDPVDERAEGQPLDGVAGQRVHHRHADLLSDVVGRADDRLLATEPAAAVAQHHRVNLGEQLLTGSIVAGDRGGHKALQQRRLVLRRLVLRIPRVGLAVIRGARRRAAVAVIGHRLGRGERAHRSAVTVMEQPRSPTCLQVTGVPSPFTSPAPAVTRWPPAPPRRPAHPRGR